MNGFARMRRRAAHRPSGQLATGRQLPASSQGFTLVEVLVALGIFAIALGSLPAVLISNIRANAYARKITTATTLAQDKLEVIRSTPYASVSGGSDTVTETGAAGTYTRSWNVTSGPTSTTRNVAITVSWTDHGGHQVALSAIISG